jgi:hypothetical protein
LLAVGANVFTAVVPATLPPGHYQVRVMGIAASGQAIGTFSDAVSFTIQ